MTRFLRTSLSLLFMCSAPLAFAAEAPLKVVTSIQPLHSLVSGVMKGVGEPVVLVEGAASPHNYSLKPSQAADLQEADAVFWVGEDLESFLEKSISSLSSEAASIELLEQKQILKLPYRDTADLTPKGMQGGHDHDDHAEHKEEGHDHDDHAAHKEEGHDHDDHAGHDHGHDHAGSFDAHIWLDPENAKAIVAVVAETLAQKDSANADTYKANAAELTEKLDILIADTKRAFEGITDGRYIVFHDAYQYFEQRFGIRPVGVVSISPEVRPGAAQVREIQSRIRDEKVSCVFSEPQFKSDLVETLIEGSDAKTETLDPLGANLATGPDQYFNLLNGMAASFQACLSKTG